MSIDNDRFLDNLPASTTTTREKSSHDNNIMINNNNNNGNDSSISTLDPIQQLRLQSKVVPPPIEPSNGDSCRSMKSPSSWKDNNNDNNDNEQSFNNNNNNDNEMTNKPQIIMEDTSNDNNKIDNGTTTNNNNDNIIINNDNDNNNKKKKNRVSLLENNDNNHPNEPIVMNAGRISATGDVDFSFQVSSSVIQNHDNRRQRRTTTRLENNNNIDQFSNFTRRRTVHFVHNNNNNGNNNNNHEFTRYTGRESALQRKLARDNTNSNNYNNNNHSILKDSMIKQGGRGGHENDIVQRKIEQMAGLSSSSSSPKDSKSTPPANNAANRTRQGTKRSVRQTTRNQPSNVPSAPGAVNVSSDGHSTYRVKGISPTGSTTESSSSNSTSSPVSTTFVGARALRASRRTQKTQIEINNDNSNSNNNNASQKQQHQQQQQRQHRQQQAATNQESTPISISPAQPQIREESTQIDNNNDNNDVPDMDLKPLELPTINPQVGNGKSKITSQRTLAPGLLCCICICVIVILVVVLLVGLGVFSNDEGTANNNGNNMDPMMQNDYLKQFQDYLQTQHQVQIIDWNDDISPQYKALSWLANQDDMGQQLLDQINVMTDATTADDETNSISSSSSFLHTRILQRYVLAVWYYSLNGIGWISSTNWLSATQHECTWEYIICNEENTLVIGISIMKYNNIYGLLPASEIQQHLPHFRELILQQHSIYTIDDNGQQDGIVLGLLPDTLEVLDLSNAKLKNWPNSIERLTRLRSLNVASNQITGSLPSNLEALSNIELLTLHGNSMDGNLETIFRSMPHLKQLDLSQNQFTGHVGELLVEWTNLPCTDINNNDDATSRSCGSLEILDLYDNQLSGIFFWDEWINTLSTSLRYIDIGSNEFMQSLPTKIGLLTMLEMLSIDSNPQISGSIPTEIGTLTNLQSLTIGYHNDMTGTLPTQIGELSNLVTLEIVTIPGLDGSLPTEVGRLESLKTLTTTHCSFSNLIPSELGLLSNSLSTIKFDGNQLSGSLPTELAQLTNLVFLSFELNSQLSGQIPLAICDLPNLKEIRPSENVVCTCDTC